MVVGRAKTCSASVDDRKLAEEHFIAEITRDEGLVLTPKPSAVIVTLGEETTRRCVVGFDDLIEAGSCAFTARQASGTRQRRLR